MQSENVFAILKQLFFGERDVAPGPSRQNARRQGNGDHSDGPHSGEEDMSKPEEKEEAPVREETGEKQASAAEEGPTTDPLQTAPLELPPEGSGLISPLFRSKGTEKASEQDLQVVERSHVGAVRERNEDSCFTFSSQSGGYAPFPGFGLFIVADGMGGHFDGHRASQIVARSVAADVLERLYLPLLREDSGARPPIQEVMEEAVQRANTALYMPDPEKKMGTTLTAALLFGRRLFLVHVGDSRAYLLTEETDLQPITTDHSVAQALQDAGQLTAEEAAVHPNRNLLYRALMGEELEQIDVFTQSLPEQGMLMLCSDGLWGLISDDEINEVLSSEQPLAGKADALVDKALEAGGHDNITVVLVDFKL